MKPESNAPSFRLPIMQTTLVLIVVLTISLAHAAEDSSTTNDQKSQAYKEISEINFNIKHEDLVIPDMRSDDQDSVDSRLWGGASLKREALRIANKLRDLANKELGVTSLQVSCGVHVYRYIAYACLKGFGLSAVF